MGRVVDARQYLIRRKNHHGRQMNSRFFLHSSLRRGIAVLALLAVALFAVQPICEAAEARLAPISSGSVQGPHVPHDSSDNGQAGGAGTCCPSVQADALASAPIPAANHAGAIIALPAFASRVQSIAFLPPIVAGEPPPLPIRPYPARSARLLR